MYKYQTVGSIIDRWMAGYATDYSDLSDENKELVDDIIKLIINKTYPNRRSAILNEGQ